MGLEKMRMSNSVFVGDPLLFILKEMKLFIYKTEIDCHAFETIPIGQQPCVNQTFLFSVYSNRTAFLTIPKRCRPKKA